jgi:hypothetical protein
MTRSYPGDGQPSSLLLARKCIECLAESRLCEVFFSQGCHARKREGGKVLAEIGAHAVEASVVHKVGLLKTRFSRNDITRGHH